MSVDEFTDEMKEENYKKVLYVIDLLTGVDLHINMEDNKIRFFKGIKDLNRKIFSRGDCGRLALILYIMFKSKLGAKIVRCMNSKWEDFQYHYCVQIHDKYFDVFGSSMITNNILNNPDYSYKILTDDEIYSDKYQKELRGNYSIVRLLGELNYCKAIHMDGIVFDIDSPYRRKPFEFSKKQSEICGHEILLKTTIFEKVFNNKKLSLELMYDELQLIYDTQLYKYEWFTKLVNNFKQSLGVEDE